MNIEPLPSLQEQKSPSLTPTTGGGLLNQWIYELTLPFIKGRILEIGTGNASITEYLITGGFQFRISDPDWEISNKLKSRLLGHPQIKAIHQIDPSRDDFEKQYEPYLNRFDTVMLLNKGNITHQDQPVLSNVAKLIRPGGHMLIRLRSEIALYNELDELFEYWKQMSRHSLKRKIGRNFEIVKSQFFNILDSTHPLTSRSDNFRQLIPEFVIEADQENLSFGIFAIVVARKLERRTYY